MMNLLGRVRPFVAGPLRWATPNMPARSLSNVVRAEFSGFKDTRSSLGAIFSTNKLYKTDITPKQFEILEEIRFMRVIPLEKAHILENIKSIEDFPKKDLIEEIKLDSVLRKRRLKMKKHKLRKRRKAQRALRRKLKKD